jgi:hypothetical protein
MLSHLAFQGQCQIVDRPHGVCAHLVPHQEPLLYSSEGHLLLLQLLVDAADGCTGSKVLLY